MTELRDIESPPGVVWPYLVRKHWVVLFSRPSLGQWILFGLLLAVAIFGGLAAWLPLLLVLGVFFALRWQQWRAEFVSFDPLAVRHVKGVKETTVSNAFMRVDRISGVVMSQTVPGKVLGYGTIHLEAPGEHPGFRNLVNVERPAEVYRLVESLMFNPPPNADPGQTFAPRNTDPDDVGGRHSRTMPLPRVPDPDLSATMRYPDSPTERFPRDYR